MISLDKLLKIFGLLFCRLGFHDFRVIDVSFVFGASSAIEKVKCRRCGRIVTRTA
jgi:hypothetical protein